MLTRIEDCIVIANGKGGVGKTSTAAGLGICWARQGYRVLLVDLDPQANLTKQELQVDGDEGKSVVAAAMEFIPSAEPVPTGRPNLDLVSAGSFTKQLTQFMGAARADDADAPGKWLLRALAELSGRYDVMIIDTPPAAGHVVADAALAVGDWLLIPTKPDEASIQGISALSRQASEVSPGRPTIRPLGAVLFGVSASATRIRAEVSRSLERRLGGVVPLLTTIIRHSEKAAVDSRREGITASEYAELAASADPLARFKGDPDAKSYSSAAAALAQDYQRLAEEVETVALKVDSRA